MHRFTWGLSAVLAGALAHTSWGQRDFMLASAGSGPVENSSELYVGQSGDDDSQIIPEVSLSTSGGRPKTPENARAWVGSDRMRNRDLGLIASRRSDDLDRVVSASGFSPSFSKSSIVPARIARVVRDLYADRDARFLLGPVKTATYFKRAGRTRRSGGPTPSEGSFSESEVQSAPERAILALLVACPAVMLVRKRRG